MLYRDYQARSGLIGQPMLSLQSQAYSWRNPKDMDFGALFNTTWAMSFIWKSFFYAHDILEVCMWCYVIHVDKWNRYSVGQTTSNLLSRLISQLAPVGLPAEKQKAAVVKRQI